MPNTKKAAPQSGAPSKDEAGIEFLEEFQRFFILEAQVD